MKYFVAVVLLAVFAVVSAHIPALNDKISEENKQSNIEKRSLEVKDGEIDFVSEAEEGSKKLTERNKRTVLYTAPVAYTAYSSPYAYARSYGYPYVASPYVASPYVASPYRSYPYVYNSPYYF
ncbi:PREDICTED: uncharacterized protein LOC107064940 [Polistes dominula]|uniref:Uncharacterized protein LOC107064940 n=1 Tax=Polistes dominula TaxID=743375 RepID=A0ABM1I088_POLDO|nr:PREDICTED: uncharacterized protein LOC107064940 [Polistes dominula]